MPTVTRYMKKVTHYLCNTRAVSALEYAILVGVIALAMAAALAAFSDSIEKGMKAIGDEIAAPDMDDVDL